MPKPALIFGDKHDDPVKLRVLTRLLPRLKTLRYDSFYDESPYDYTLGVKGSYEEAIEHHNRELGFYFLSLRIYLEKSPVNINHDLSQITLSEYKNNPNSFLELVKNIIRDSSNNPLYSKLCRTAKKIILTSAQEIFLQTLKSNRIQYQGVDDCLSYSIIKGALEDYLETGIGYGYFRAIEKLRPIRDKTLSTAYFSAKQPIFARTGAAHLKGIQEELINQISISEEKTAEDFLFFYICSSQKDIDYCSELKLKLPLGIIAIDARTETDDEIVEFITHRIIERKKIQQPCIQALQNLSMFEKPPETESSSKFEEPKKSINRGF